MDQRELLGQLDPSASVNQIQTYIQRVIAMRGFADQPIQASMLLLLEETGELAKAIRKSSGMTIDTKRIANYDTVESEVADVFIVLVSICNSLGINLYDALIEKEKVNCERSWAVNP